MGVLALDDFSDLSVQRGAALQEDASVGYLMGQRVFESVFEFREQLRFVNEFGFFEAFQPETSCLDRCFRDGFQYFE